MARILSISSEVAFGSVGNSSVVPALIALGHRAMSLPTAVLSNHPGLGPPSGVKFSAAELESMLSAMETAGAFASLDAVSTGYFTGAEQVEAAARAIGRLKQARPDMFVFCDPIIGDDHTGIYVPLPVAEAIRELLLPLADAISPNRFELAWLSGRHISSEQEAIAASRALPCRETLVTSVPGGQGRLLTLLVERAGHSAISTAIRPDVPHGTGDLLSGLWLGNRLACMDRGAALGRALAVLEFMIDSSAGHPELRLDLLATAIGQPAAGAVSGNGVAGVDGCPKGWLVVQWDPAGGRPPRACLCRTFEEVLALDASVIAVDMPIGLPRSSGRSCETEVRSRLGMRQSSVFAVPSRMAFAARDYREACSINERNSDPPRKVSRQCFGLFPKIREIDKLITASMQERVLEVHPELAFWAMNGERALELPKKVKGRPHADGLVLRENLLRKAGFPLDGLVRSALPRSGWGADDLLDACAACWSAARIRQGRHVRFPLNGTYRDERGLRMEINA